MLENKEGFARIEDFGNIQSKDIIKYSQKIQAQKLRKKIEEIFKTGKDIKQTLLKEKYYKDYSNFLAKLNRLLQKGGEDSIQEIKRKNKNQISC